MNSVQDRLDTRALLAAAQRFAQRFGRRGLLDTDDIAQLAMEKALAKNDRRPVSLTWLYSVVRNIANDASRSQQREAKYLARFDYSSGGSVSEFIDSLSAGRLAFEQSLVPDFDYEASLSAQLNQTMRQLSDPFKRALALYADGRSYKQIAEITDSSIGTVRSRIHLARKRAKELLGTLD